MILNYEVRRVGSKWHTFSESGKHMGGPYPTKAHAEHRLWQMEYFKVKQSERPLKMKEFHTKWKRNKARGLKKKQAEVMSKTEAHKFRDYSLPYEIRKVGSYWHVYSEKGRHLGGPYPTKGRAQHRLRQVEWFKHDSHERPMKKRYALTDPIIKAKTLAKIIPTKGKVLKWGGLMGTGATLQAAVDRKHVREEELKRAFEPNRVATESNYNLHYGPMPGWIKTAGDVAHNTMEVAGKNVGSGLIHLGKFARKHPVGAGITTTALVGRKLLKRRARRRDDYAVPWNAIRQTGSELATLGVKGIKGTHEVLKASKIGYPALGTVSAIKTIKHERRKHQQQAAQYALNKKQAAAKLFGKSGKFPTIAQVFGEVKNIKEPITEAMNLRAKKAHKVGAFGIGSPLEENNLFTQWVKEDPRGVWQSKVLLDASGRIGGIEAPMHPLTTRVPPPTIMQKLSALGNPFRLRNLKKTFSPSRLGVKAIDKAIDTTRLLGSSVTTAGKTALGAGLIAGTGWLVKQGVNKLQEKHPDLPEVKMDVEFVPEYCIERAHEIAQAYGFNTAQEFMVRRGLQYMAAAVAKGAAKAAPLLWKNMTKGQKAWRVLDTAGSVGGILGMGQLGWELGKPKHKPGTGTMPSEPTQQRNPVSIGRPGDTIYSMVEKSLSFNRQGQPRPNNPKHENYSLEELGKLLPLVDDAAVMANNVIQAKPNLLKKLKKKLFVRNKQAISLPGNDPVPPQGSAKQDHSVDTRVQHTASNPHYALGVTKYVPATLKAWKEHPILTEFGSFAKNIAIAADEANLSANAHRILERVPHDVDAFGRQMHLAAVKTARQIKDDRIGAAASKLSMARKRIQTLEKNEKDLLKTLHTRPEKIIERAPKESKLSMGTKALLATGGVGTASIPLAIETGRHRERERINKLLSTKKQSKLDKLRSFAHIKTGKPPLTGTVEKEVKGIGYSNVKETLKVLGLLGLAAGTGWGIKEAAAISGKEAILRQINEDIVEGNAEPHFVINRFMRK